MTFLRRWLCGDLEAAIAILIRRADRLDKQLDDLDTTSLAMAQEIKRFQEKLAAREQVVSSAKPHVRVAANWSQFRHAAENPPKQEN